MAKLSWSRAALVRMEAREATVHRLIKGVSGSRSASTCFSTVCANLPLFDASATALLPKRKELISTSLIREYTGLPEDPKDSMLKGNDTRRSNIRVGYPSIELAIVALT